MPRGDRTGPDGMGPMTGRSAGFCAGYDRPGFTNPGYGGFGRGRGGGRGLGWRFWLKAAGVLGSVGYGLWNSFRPNISKDEEKEMLKQEAEGLKKNLEALNNRLKDLEKE